MLSRLCSRLSLRLTVVRLDTCLTYDKGRRGFTNIAEHNRCILTYAGKNGERNKQTRFCSYSGTISGLVLRLTDNIHFVSGARLALPCFLRDGFNVMETIFISAK
jgi:hypothetical protein